MVITNLKLKYLIIIANHNHNWRWCFISISRSDIVDLCFALGAICAVQHTDVELLYIGWQRVPLKILTVELA